MWKYYLGEPLRLSNDSLGKEIREFQAKRKTRTKVPRLKRIEREV